MIQHFFGCDTANVTENRERSEAYIRLSENLLENYVEVPPQFQKLDYCNVLPGIVEGISQMQILKLGWEATYRNKCIRITNVHCTDE